MLQMHAIRIRKRAMTEDTKETTKPPTPTVPDLHLEI